MIVLEGDQGEDDEFNGIVEGEAEEEGDDDSKRERVARITCGTIVSLVMPGCVIG